MPRPLSLAAGNDVKLTVSDTGDGIDTSIMTKRDIIDYLCEKANLTSFLLILRHELIMRQRIPLHYRLNNLFYNSRRIFKRDLKILSS